MNNEWLIQIYHAFETDEFNRIESVALRVSDGEAQFEVPFDASRKNAQDKIRILKNGEPFEGNWIVYDINLVVIDVPPPSVVVDYKVEPLDSICDHRVPPAIVAKWRTEFETRFYNVEFNLTLDAWKRTMYEHPHVQSLWAGYVAGKQSLVAEIEAEKQANSESQTIFVLWNESGVVHANEFANTPDARNAAKECIEFVEGRAGAELKNVIIGSKFDVSKL